MNIPVLLEPTPTGFRASTGAPLNLTAEAATAEAAAAEVRRQFAVMQAGGARVVQLSLPEPDRLFELAAQLGANPLFEDWVASVKEYRRQREAEEEAEEAAKAAAAPEPPNLNGHPAPTSTATDPAV